MPTPAARSLAVASLVIFLQEFLEHAIEFLAFGAVRGSTRLVTGATQAAPMAAANDSHILFWQLLCHLNFLFLLFLFFLFLGFLLFFSVFGRPLFGLVYWSFTGGVGGYHPAACESSNLQLQQGRRRLRRVKHTIDGRTKGASPRRRSSPRKTKGSERRLLPTLQWCQSTVRRKFPASRCLAPAPVPRTVRLSEAPSFGQPITVFDPTSRGAVAYRDLAKEVSNGVAQRTR